MTINAETQIGNDSRFLASVNFSDAQLKGLSLDGCTFASSPRSLILDRAQVAGAVVVTDSDVFGGVHLLGANVRNELRFTNCRLAMSPVLKSEDVDASNDAMRNSRSSPIVLAVDRATIGSDFYINDCNISGEIHAISTDVGGLLDFSGCRFVDDLLDVVRAVRPDEVPSELSELPPEERLLPTGVTVEHIKIEDRLRWKDVTVARDTFLNLFQARASKLVDDVESWPSRGNLILDGFVYDTIAVGPTDAESRLDWLSRQGEHQRASSYEQVASVIESLGKERDADQIRIAGQKFRRRSPDTSRATRTGLALLEATAGYGYRPGRAFIWILAAMLSGMIFFGLADHAGAVRPSEAPAAADFSPIAYSIDSFVPVIDFGYADDWDVGQWTGREIWVVAYLWLHITLGWVLTGIAVVAVTGFSRQR